MSHHDIYEEPITRITGSMFGSKLAIILLDAGFRDLRQLDSKSKWEVSDD